MIIMSATEANPGERCRRRLGRRLTRLITLGVYVTKSKFPPDKLIALTISGSEQSDLDQVVMSLTLTASAQAIMSDWFPSAHRQQRFG